MFVKGINSYFEAMTFYDEQSILLLYDSRPCGDDVAFIKQSNEQILIGNEEGVRVRVRVRVRMKA